MAISQKEAKTNRIHMLDGLRGFAILLVFLNHIDSGPLIEAVPKFLQPVLKTFFSSGVTGVSLLFILCGFLMAYLYPQPHKKTEFIQKRYTRIFPLFLSMVSAMAIFHVMPQLHWIARLAVIFGIAAVGYCIWMLIKKINNFYVSRGIFLLFIALQVAVGLWYLIILRKPPVYLSTVLPPAVRDLTIYLVNATLMLPLGDYIGMLDGVYWSLGSEVLFYILYPFIVAPLVTALIPQSRKIKILFLLFLIPFLGGVHQLSRQVFEFNMLQFPLYFYFATGILLGYLYRNKPQAIEYLENKWKSITKIDLSLPLFLISLVLIWASFEYTRAELHPWIRMAWAFPLTFLIATSLTAVNHFSKILNSKYLIFMGAISYSVYLCHTSLVNTAHLIYKPIHMWGNILFLIVTFAAVVGVAFILNYLLEKPYFIKRTVGQTDDKKISYKLPIGRIVIGLIGGYLIAIFLAYQAHFNFFSLEEKHTNVATKPQIDLSKNISMRENHKILFEVPALHNNFGIVTMNFTYMSDTSDPSYNQTEDQRVIFRFKERGAETWLTEAEYKLVEIGNSPNHPFGFPAQLDSKGKTYEMELETLYPKSPAFPQINTSEAVFKTVYQINKGELLKKPDQLAALVTNRIKNVVTNNDAQKVLLLALPVFGLLTLLLLSRKKHN